MTKATHAAILGVCYLLAPLGIFVGLVTIGTFTGDIPATNIMIFIFILVGSFVGLILSFVRQYRIRALMLVCSVAVIAVCVWRSGDDTLRHYLYTAEVVVTPHFDKKCIPPAGIPFNGDALRLCSVHDLNLAGWIDLIVKIDGSYPEERLIDDVNSGNIDPAIGRLGKWAFVFGEPNMLTGQHLLSDYYLIRYHMCGNVSPYC